MGRDRSRSEEEERSYHRRPSSGRKEEGNARGLSTKRRESERKERDSGSGSSADDGSIESDRKRDDRRSRKSSRQDDDDSDRGGRRKDERKRRKRRSNSSEDDSDDSSGRKHKRRKRKKSSRKHKKDKKRRKREKGPSSSDSDSDDDDDNGGEASRKIVNERLLAKLAARGETLEERKERRAQKRAAYISEKFGYTAEENPFNDANLHETFTWKKRDEKKPKQAKEKAESRPDNRFDEIDKVRKRRKDRELQMEEMERIRAEESRMKELENYDDWAKKEEEFHLQQQRQRSAIRLLEGREKPIDVLAKNVLLFGLTEEEKRNRAAVKYQEKFNAMDALETLEAELEEPPSFLRMLKLEELQELLGDIEAFRSLEREASKSISNVLANESENTVLRYWDALRVVADDEIKYLKSGGSKGSHADLVAQIEKIFEGQSKASLLKMKDEVNAKATRVDGDPSLVGMEGEADRSYWKSVSEQLLVHLSKTDLKELHAQMLVRQLERLERKREELAKLPPEELEKMEAEAAASREQAMPADNSEAGTGDLEEELGLTDEVNLEGKQYSWEDKYRPRKPRYFNRVKTGWDWNKYNQTHYDKDNPPPKVVQGYRFEVFYPDLIDHTKTPQFSLEPADSDEFCIIRFHAGPPYEDIAFKIINREWNRSRKRGYRCTFERGVLSLHFNFTTHWYRR